MSNRAIKTADLSGLDLDRAVHSILHPDSTTDVAPVDYAAPHSTAWLSIADEAGILCGPSPFPGAAYAAGIGTSWDDAVHIQTGDTRAEAALRCFAASLLGPEVTLLEMPPAVAVEAARKMRKEPLRAIPGTAMKHDLTKHYPGVRTAALTPELTMPVFELPKGLALVEAVAVTFRDASENPNHGGLFAMTPAGEVVEISLVDQEHGVDTDDDPAHIAIGMVMSIGKLMVRGDNGTTELPWSIVDFGINTMDDPILRPTPSRLAVHAAYRAQQLENVPDVAATERNVVQNLQGEFRSMLQRPVAGLDGITIEGALGADWSAVYGSLIQARDYLQKDGARHTWLDGAIAVADSRAKVPVPDAYLQQAKISPQGDDPCPWSAHADPGHFLGRSDSIVPTRGLGHGLQGGGYGPKATMGAWISALHPPPGHRLGPLALTDNPLSCANTVLAPSSSRPQEFLCQIAPSKPPTWQARTSTRSSIPSSTQIPRPPRTISAPRAAPTLQHSSITRASCADHPLSQAPPTPQA